jgi:hypothetical protein
VRGADAFGLDARGVVEDVAREMRDPFLRVGVRHREVADPAPTAVTVPQAVDLLVGGAAGGAVRHDLLRDALAIVGVQQLRVGDLPARQFAGVPAQGLLDVRRHVLDRPARRVGPAEHHHRSADEQLALAFELRLRALDGGNVLDLAEPAFRSRTTADRREVEVAQEPPAAAHQAALAERRECRGASGGAREMLAEARRVVRMGEPLRWHPLHLGSVIAETRRQRIVHAQDREVAREDRHADDRLAKRGAGTQLLEHTRKRVGGGIGGGHRCGVCEFITTGRGKFRKPLLSVGCAAPAGTPPVRERGRRRTPE